VVKSRGIVQSHSWKSSNLFAIMSLTAKLVGGCWLAKRQIAAIGDSPVNDADGTVQGEDTDQMIHKVQPGILDSVALVGVGGSLVSMMMTQGYLVDVASVMTMGLAPYCVYQKRELKELGGLRGQQNELRQHVNSLQVENNTLAASIDTLEVNVGKLEGVEAALTQIAKDANTDSTRLVKIVTEMKGIQTKIKANLEREVMQSVLQVLVQADSNQDFCLNAGEKEMLVLRLSSLPGVAFDEKNFRKMMGSKDLKLSDLMGMLRNLMDDGIPENDNIFHLQPASLLK